MGKECLLKPSELISLPGFSVKLYNPGFKEFIVYSVSSHGGEGKIPLKKIGIMIVLKGSLSLLKEAKFQIKGNQYSAWLLEPGEYSFIVLESPMELYIAIEACDISSLL